MIKIMSYNTGGCGKKVEAIIHLIKKESPDILALNEVCSSIINKIPQQLDMPHYAISTPVSKLNNTGLFSRYKLNNIKKFLSFTNSGVNANIYTPLGEVSVGALHLAPNTEQTRLAELTKVINWQSGHKNKVILGDLNAISPLDKVFIKIKGRMVVVKAEYEVINLLAQNNYTDASTNHTGVTIPTVPKTVDGDNTYYNLRLDYIFTSGKLFSQSNKYKVVINDKTKLLSDHFPIIATYL